MMSISTYGFFSQKLFCTPLHSPQLSCGASIPSLHWLTLQPLNLARDPKLTICPKQKCVICHFPNDVIVIYSNFVVSEMLLEMRLHDFVCVIMAIITIIIMMMMTTDVVVGFAE